MEQQEVINPGVAIWVTEYSLHNKSPLVWKSSGIPLDGYHGFGDNKTRYFNGEVVLLASTNKSVQYLSISNAHFSREGFKWLIREAESLLQPPFLISSDLVIQNIFDGYIEISEDKEVINFYDPDGYSYAVATRYWFGVMTIEENNKVHLIAFSPNKNVTVLDKDELWSFEWDCPICKIKLLRS